MPKENMLSPVLLAIVIAIFSALSFTGGFAVSNWRSGAEIARLKSSNSVLEAENGKCSVDIKSVRQGVDEIKKAADERIKAAQVEVVKVQPKADMRAQRAITIIAAPIRKDETLCQAVEREQIEYLVARRDQ